MNRFFYGRLAFSNLKKNSGLYLPYILAAIGVSAVYYIMGAISRDEGIKKMPGSGDVAMILGLGCWVIAIFAVIFLFYTNSFLMKRRKKEFGLFNTMASTETLKPKGTSKSTKRISIKTTNLLSKIPTTIPKTILTLATITISQNIIFPIWRFSMPKILNRPNSFLRRFIRKLLV